MGNVGTQTQREGSPGGDGASVWVLGFQAWREGSQMLPLRLHSWNLYIPWRKENSQGELSPGSPENTGMLFWQRTAAGATARGASRGLACKGADSHCTEAAREKQWEDGAGPTPAIILA